MTDYAQTNTSIKPGLWCLARDAAVAGQRAVATALHSDEPGESHSMAGHIGSAHLSIDVIAHQAVERFVYSAYDGHVQVVGEEVRRSLWTPVGGLVVTVDPVDGTGPALDLGFGWSTVVLVHRLARVSNNGRSGWRLVGAAIADCCGNIMSFVRPNVVLISTAIDGRGKVARVRPSRSSGSVALVGAKSSSRRNWTETVGGLTGTAYNLGGTPTAWGLLTGRLGASVIASPTTHWDAAQVLLASQAGAVVMDLESGARVASATVIEWFSTPEFEDGTGGAHIRPCVVAVDNDAAVSVAGASRTTADSAVTK